ncbi:FAD binding domain-containing protein [Flagelloscypha sp. PMI_526]|nr:FAD binding domain-containing protein [Flagelloscypha sp. PMI_526]
MQSESSQPPVLIVGAGLSGLTVAVTLLQNNVPVRVISNQPSRGQYFRGSVVVPRTVEAHRFLGTYERFREASRIFPQAVLYGLPGGTEVVKHFSMRETQKSTPWLPDATWMLCPQYKHETLLQSFLATEFSQQVQFNHELTSFSPASNEAAIRNVETGDIETQQYSYIISAEGAHSSIRKQLGLNFVSDLVGNAKFILLDVEVLSELDTTIQHFWGNMAEKMVGLWHSSGNHFISFMTGEWDHQYIIGGLENFIELFREFTGRNDIVFGKLIAPITSYTPYIRMVDRFSVGNTFLLGDAAHIQSPTGGQGLNSSIQDAVNLGWKLSLVYHRLSPPSLLETYHEERFPVIQEMLLRTTKLPDKTRTAKETNEALKRGSDTDQLGVNYRWSSIILDEVNERATADADTSALTTAYDVNPEIGAILRAGERAPSANGFLDSSGNNSELILFDLFSIKFHRLLLFAPTSEVNLVKNVIEALKAYPVELVKTAWVLPQGDSNEPNVGFTGPILVDNSGSAYAGYGLQGHVPTIVIVRPDGVVGAIVKEVEGIGRYFAKIFVSA